MEHEDTEGFETLADLPEQGAQLLKQDDRIDAVTWPEDRVSSPVQPFSLP